MSNYFSCNVTSGNSMGYILTKPFLGLPAVRINYYSFFYCAQPNATSASIQNIKTNFREYYVERVKLDIILKDRYPNDYNYVMLFVLNVPQDYVPTLPNRRLSELPSHTMPENVLYYDLVCIGRFHDTKNISIDIKKRFRVSPSYKLDFVCYNYVEQIGEIDFEGTAQVFFDVN